MNVNERVSVDRIGLFAAAVLIGASIGTLASPGTATVPLAGAVPEFLVGGVGLVLGGGLYLGVKRSSDDCGCGGACDC